MVSAEANLKQDSTITIDLLIISIRRYGPPL